MKKIINGKKYDTNTAEWLGQHNNGLMQTDLFFLGESLYRKRTGEYFIWGKGGANTSYSVSCGPNSWCGSSKIIPLSQDKAKEWAQKHLSGDRYEEIFGPAEE